MKDNRVYAKLQLHLKRSNKFLEKNTNAQIVANLKKELELSGLENDGELSKPQQQQHLQAINHTKNEQPKI